MNTAENLAIRQADYLPGLLGFTWIEAGPRLVRGRLEVERRHQASTGYLHAATVVALADTACGFGCQLSLPDNAIGFTTAELKANFIGTVREGVVLCDARMVHGGRTTQVWDATLESAVSQKTIALFRCTQILLYKQRGAPKA